MKSLLGGALATVRNLTPVPYTTSRRAGTLAFPMADRADPEAMMRAMGAVGTLFAIVNRTSNATAQVNWHLWRKAASGLAEDRVEVTRHAALDLWNKPNPFMPRQEFVEVFQQHVDLTGESEWVIARNPQLRSMPLELWPVRPDRMTPVPDPIDFLAGWVYTTPDGQKIPLGVRDVIQLRMPNPLDPYRGMGPVQSLLTDLDATKFSAQWNRNFFINSAAPGGIIEVDKRLSDDEFDEMALRWREQHQGVANAHRVAIVEQGKWVDRAFSMRDMQFTELREVSREVIREAFGFPKPLLGSVDDVNRANAEAGEVVFARWLIVPRLERIKAALNNDLLPQYGPTAAGLEFDYDNPVPEDRASDTAEMLALANTASIYIDAGFTAVSVVEALGLPSMLVYEEPAAPQPVIAPAPELRQMEPAARRSRRPRAAADDPPDLDPADLPDVSPLQDQWEQALDDLLTEWDQLTADQKAELVAAIRQIAEDGSLVDLATLQVDTGPASDALTAAMLTVAASAAARVVAEGDDQGVTVHPKTPRRAEFAAVAQVVAALLGHSLADSAAGAAMRANGPAATPDDIAEAVTEHLDTLTDAQARQQLGAALTGAQNAARTATLAAGPVGAIYSSEKNDSNTCGPCREVNGRWLGNTDDLAMVEKSYPAGAFGGYLHCKGGPRCRGTVVGVWREGGA